MGHIPKPKAPKNNRIENNSKTIRSKNNNIVFSFEALENNEFFNLDATCPSWSSDLFEALKSVSTIDVNEVYAGKYTGKSSTLRIHNHSNAIPPCPLPSNVQLDDFWQIRISLSKGGIHGVFSDNVFYIMWLDPQHNMYPSKLHGGLKKIRFPMTCCKDRDNELEVLGNKITNLEDEILIYKEWMNEAAGTMELNEKKENPGN